MVRVTLRTTPANRPLVAARGILRQFMSLHDGGETQLQSVEVAVSTDVWEQLEHLQSLSAFTAEIAEVLASVSGTSCAVSIIERTDLPPTEVRLEASPSKIPPSPPDDERSVAGPPTSNPAPRLTLTLGDQQVPIGESVTIGRSSSCDLVVRDTEASRRHAEVSKGTAGPVITDLGSTNGTMVNNARISGPVTLNAGDAVTIGATTIRVIRQ